MSENRLSQLNLLEETALPTMWCRTFYFRSYANSPDLQAERILKSLSYECTDDSPDKSAVAAYRVLHLGRRAHRIDGLTREYLAQNPNALIVNAGAGLETFFSRVDNGKLKGLSLDQKNTIELRNELKIDESERFSSMICDDLADPEWLKGLDASNGLLIVMAGVGMYLSPSVHQRLLNNIREFQPSAKLIMDYHSPIGMRLSNFTIATSSHAKVYFQSGWTRRSLTRTCPGLRIISDEDLGDVREVGVSLSTPAIALSHFARAVRFSRLAYLEFGGDRCA